MGNILPAYKLSSPFRRVYGWGAVMYGSVEDLRFTVLNASGVEFLCPVYILNSSATSFHVSKEVLNGFGSVVIPR